MANREKVIEAVIGLALQLKASIVALCQAYRSRPILIDREEKAIRTHDFGALSALRDEYEALNELVERNVQQLRALGLELSEILLTCAAQDRPAVAQVPVNVSGIIEILNKIMLCLKNEIGPGLAINILEHLITSLSKDWRDFASEKVGIEAKIERNHVIMSTLLENYQKSFQFWYEVVEKCSSSYDARGQQSTNGRVSAFNVRV